MITNSTFIDNRISLNFAPYGEAFPSSAIKNKSYVSHNTFDCESAVHGGNGINHHIALVETHGVAIYDNTFKNSASPGTFADDFRGRGINAINSTLNIDAWFDPDPFMQQVPCDLPEGVGNKFENLTYGIVTYDYASFQVKSNKILESEIKNCKIGMELKNTGITKVYKNAIIRDDNLIADGIWVTTNEIGIHTINVANANVDQNSIITSAHPFTPSFTGFKIDNSLGLPFELYNNSVTNQTLPLNSFTSLNTKHYTGVNAVNNNSQLDLRCHLFTNLNIDLDVTGNFKTQGAPGMSNSIQFTDLPAYNQNFIRNVWNRNPTPFDVYTGTGMGGNKTFFGGPGEIFEWASIIPCNLTSPCAIRQFNLSPGGSDFDEGGGGFGTERTGGFIDPIVQGHLKALDYSSAYQTALYIQDQNKAALHHWYIQFSESKRNLIDLDSQDIRFLIKFACLPDENGTFAKQLLETFSSATFACRNWPTQNMIMATNPQSKQPTSGLISSLDMAIFPNPNNGHFTVQYEFTQAAKAQLSISNVWGKIEAVYHLTEQTGLLKFDNLNLPAGVYFVTLQSATGEQITKKMSIIR